MAGTIDKYRAVKSISERQVTEWAEPLTLMSIVCLISCTNTTFGKMRSLCEQAQRKVGARELLL